MASTRRLQLLSQSIEFVDPFSGETRRFESRLQLAGAPAAPGPLDSALAFGLVEPG